MTANDSWWPRACAPATGAANPPTAATSPAVVRVPTRVRDLIMLPPPGRGWQLGSRPPVGLRPGTLLVVYRLGHTPAMNPGCGWLLRFPLWLWEVEAGAAPADLQGAGWQSLSQGAWRAGGSNESRSTS